MDMSFNGILHSHKGVDKATGLSGSIQTISPMFEVDYAEIFKYLPAGNLTLKASMGDKELGEMTHVRMVGPTGKTSKEGTFLHITFEGDHNRGFIKLGDKLGESMTFNIEVVKDGDEAAQGELGETE